MSENKTVDPVDEAARLLRCAVSITAVKEQRAITVLCEEIERLRREVVRPAPNEQFGGAVLGRALD